MFSLTTTRRLRLIYRDCRSSMHPLKRSFSHDVASWSLLFFKLNILRYSGKKRVEEEKRNTDLANRKMSWCFILPMREFPSTNAMDIKSCKKTTKLLFCSCFFFAEIQYLVWRWGGNSASAFVSTKEERWEYRNTSDRGFHRANLFLLSFSSFSCFSLISIGISSL